MKRFIFLLVIVIATVGCKKEDISTTYTIVVNKYNPHQAILKINNVPYTFADNEFSQNISIKEYDVVDVSLDYTTSQTDIMQLSIKKEASTIASVSGNDYMWIVFSNSSASKGGGYSSGSGSSSGTSSSTSHYCGYPTKDGTPCQRRVSGTTGYCWQHR